ncbi:hypothetical protein VTN77DRAFT_8552 [Rasamsonia byssochlamydoides]|uniref:uncharacterized protein n=1 Tax=Rasamsonia byssochlamydoides TaxID=89139 RepID=UPI003743C06D
MMITVLCGLTRKEGQRFFFSFSGAPDGVYVGECACVCFVMSHLNRSPGFYFSFFSPFCPGPTCLQCLLLFHLLPAIFFLCELSDIYHFSFLSVCLRCWCLHTYLPYLHYISFLTKPPVRSICKVSCLFFQKKKNNRTTLRLPNVSQSVSTYPMNEWVFQSYYFCF